MTSFEKINNGKRESIIKVIKGETTISKQSVLAGDSPFPLTSDTVINFQIMSATLFSSNATSDRYVMLSVIPPYGN